VVLVFRHSVPHPVDHSVVHFPLHIRTGSRNAISNNKAGGTVNLFGIFVELRDAHYVPQDTSFFHFGGIVFGQVHTQWREDTQARDHQKLVSGMRLHRREYKI
jgi:hypothetical protein